MAKAKKPTTSNTLTVETFKHEEATRTNIPTAEYQSVMREEDKRPIPVTYRRGVADADGLATEKAQRQRDFDPQLVWRGKDQQDWADLVVHAPPLYIQEKIHPKALIDDLRRQSASSALAETAQINLFADFNGLPENAERTDFYQHSGHWSNRMILGDSLQVMASLAEREGLRGQVQCIYLDPPYGIKFNSNFQWSTTSRDVKDGNPDHITREPEQVKAFRDTWRDGIHSYLTYLRDRLTVARDLLADSGSIFVQIGDENVHRVRAVMDEVFGSDASISMIAFTKGATGLSASGRMPARLDYILWYGKSVESSVKYRPLYTLKNAENDSNFNWMIYPTGLRARRSQFDDVVPDGVRLGQDVSLTKPGPGAKFEVEFQGRKFDSGKRWWGTTKEQIERALKTDRIIVIGNSLRHLRYLDESSLTAIGNLWDGFLGQSSPVYVVQTNVDVIQRCILMSTDPGDLVLDPTCGSGTTAYVAEHWGRRWITIDTSRVALTLARLRLMGARYPYYLLADSPAGQLKEAELTGSRPATQPTYNTIRHGFVYERVPHITLKSIANNADIDTIWEHWQQTLEPLRAQLNHALGTTWEEWEIPRAADANWPAATAALHADWWQARIKRQREIDASIAAKADFEYLYDKPYDDKKTVRVAGPFTVESLSPHRVLGLDENDELIDPLATKPDRHDRETRDFVTMILDNLKTAGVQQAHKADRITFSALSPWPGQFICAEGRFLQHTATDPDSTDANEQTTEQRAAIFIGPEFGTVSRTDLAEAAREAAESGFDLLIACAFNYDAHSTEIAKLGRLPVLKARMNADLHMAEDLKNTGKGNLFVIFGEPDIEIQRTDDGHYRIQVNGVDVFHPSTGEVRSDGPEGIACWMIDTDYNQEAFFVRHAYFLGANDPYKALRTTLKTEIDADAWATLNSHISRPFPKPSSGRIAVKVINHLGDEVMKVFRV